MTSDKVMCLFCHVTNGHVTTCTKYLIGRSVLWEGHSIFSDYDPPTHIHVLTKPVNVPILTKSMNAPLNASKRIFRDFVMT